MDHDTRYENARRFIPPRRRVLDYGCGSGDFLQYVAADIVEGVGVDLDRDRIAQAARQNKHPHIRYLCADARSNLPFPANYFDVITALGVLEHVGPEQLYLDEFFRVLRPGGHVVIDVPSKGPFRWMDVGNIKYNFPRLHRWFYLHVVRDPNHYRRHFSGDAKMFGQFSKEAEEHKHYGNKDIKDLLGSRFKVVDQFNYGLFYELIQFNEVLVTKLLHFKGRRLFSALIELDCRIPSFLARANLVVHALRAGEGGMALDVGKGVQ